MVVFSVSWWWETVVACTHTYIHIYSIPISSQMWVCIWHAAVCHDEETDFL